MNKLLIATTLSIMLLPVVALAEVTYGDVADKMKIGDVQTAEMLTRQLLKEHPDSAKAHYYMGQILATEADYKAAYSELKKSASLDKSLSFASSPDKFRQEMDKVQMNLGKVPVPEISNHEDKGFGWGTLFTLLGLGGLIYWFARPKPKPESQKEERTYKPNPAANHPSYASSSPRSAGQPTAEYRTSASYVAPSYTAPQVVNNYHSGNDGLVEGMLLGSMMSSHSTSNTVIDRQTIIERDTTSNVVQPNQFDAGSDNSSKDNDFDSGNDSDSSKVFDSGSDNSSSFDSGSSSFDSGGSSFDSGSSGGDSN